MSKPISTDELRKRLRQECEKAGGQKAWAETAQVSGAYVSDVLHGRREPGDSICRALGYRRRVDYIPDAWEAQKPDAWKDKK